MVGATAKKRIVTFNGFEVDLFACELRKQGVKIQLQEKPFQALAMLLERAGEFVSREELRHALWPTGIYVDFDHSLNIAVAKLRHALSESANSPSLIETVGSRGYRLRVPALEIHSSAKLPSRIRLAVLPFKDLDGVSDQALFADGMTEEIITQLGQLYGQRLGVISKTSTETYRNTHKRIKEIGRELKAHYILEGGMRRIGDCVRITTQLSQASDETIFWSETYDHVVGDVTTQIRLAQKIAQSLKLELLPAWEETIVRRSTSSPEAYVAYLKGYHHQSKRTEEGLWKSIGYFEQAIQKDQNYAIGYCALAESKALLGSMGFGGGKPEDFFPAARQAALKALELNDGLAEAHASLAAIKYLYDWDWESTEKLLRRANELNPSNTTVYRLHSRYLTSRGRYEEAIREGQRACDLDPLSLHANVSVATALYFARKYDEAIEQLLKVLELQPDFGPALMVLALAWEQKSAFAKAISALELARVYSAGNTTLLACLAEAYGKAGLIDEAQSVLYNLVKMSKSRYVPAFDFAVIHFALGDKDKALDYLEKAYLERSPLLPLFLKTDPRFEALSLDARFRDLLHRVGL